MSLLRPSNNVLKLEMAPFATIISEVRPREETGDVSIPQMMEKGEAIEFHAQVDDEWLFFNVPNGGETTVRRTMFNHILPSL